MRQGRLKLALEEVLTTQPDPTDPATLQSPHDNAASFTTPNGDSAPFTAAIAAPTSAPAEAVSNLYSQTGDAQANARHPGPSPAALRVSQDAPLELPSLQSRRDSQLSSGRLSYASSTSGPGLPSPTELAGKSSSPSPSHGTEFEFPLQSRRHSLHRAPKVCSLLIILHAPSNCLRIDLMMIGPLDKTADVHEKLWCRVSRRS